MSQVTESTMPFQDGATWYRVTVPDVPVPGALPLVVLHGGPGAAHDRSTGRSTEVGSEEPGTLGEGAGPTSVDIEKDHR